MKTPKELFKGFTFQLRGELWTVHFSKKHKDLRNADGLCYQRNRRILLEELPNLNDVRRVFWHEYFHAIGADCMDVSYMRMTGNFFEELYASITASAIMELIPQLVHLPKCLLYDTEEV